MKKKMLLSLICALVLPAANTLAQDTSLYGFFDAGFTRYNEPTADEAAAGFAAGFGYRMEESIDFELAYVEYGPADLRSSETVQGELDTRSFSLAANLGAFSLGEVVTLQAILGMEYLRTEKEFIPGNTLVGAPRTDKENDSEALFGLGLTIEGDSDIAKARVRLTSNADGDIIRLALGVKVF